MSVLTCLTFYIWCTALSVLHLPPLPPIVLFFFFLTKMQLSAFGSGGYKAAYRMTDLFVIYANGALRN